MRIVGVAVLLPTLVACASQAPVSSSVTQCSMPRPQVCTMEYAPACATLVEGGRKEYASGCNACADDAVAGYTAGPCPE